MEYGGFEGIIPKGQYGGGTVMLWDQGTWEPQPAYPDVEAGLRDGSLKFILHGAKLKGKWALIRMKGGRFGSDNKPGAKPNWLLIKEHDPFERTDQDPPITEAEPNSVVTGRSIEQIAASEDHVWNSKDTANPNAKPGIAATNSSDAPSLATSTPKVVANIAHPVAPAVAIKLPQAPKESQPAIHPATTRPAGQPPALRSRLAHELKLDGYRIQARKNGSQVQLLTRTGLDWTHRMKSIAADVATLPAADRHARWRGRRPRAPTAPPASPTCRPHSRKAPNAQPPHLLRLRPPPPQRPQPAQPSARRAQSPPRPTPRQIAPDISASASTSTPTAPPSSAEPASCTPRASSPSAPTPNTPPAAPAPTGSRCKCLREQEFVIGGFTLPAKGHAGIHGVGALLLGYYDKSPSAKSSSVSKENQPNLIYAGRTGTGFTQKTHKLLRDQTR